MINESNHPSAPGEQTGRNLARDAGVEVSSGELDAAESPHSLPPQDRTALRFYLHEIAKTPLLKIEEETRLANLVLKGDRKARDHMIKANLRLVVKIAMDYSNFGLPLLDLISEGNLGLVKAVERFDPSKGGKLSTYAAWWIKQNIKRALANQGKPIRMPVHTVEKIAQMRRVINRLTEELGREPNNDEIAYEMGVPLNKVAHLKALNSKPASLDAPVGEDSDSARLGDLVRDEDAVTPYENLRSQSSIRELRSVVDSLEPREAEIIRYRFGLKGGEPMTLEDIGVKFGVTRERVRQLQNLALHKLRQGLADRDKVRSTDEVQEEEVARAKVRVWKDFMAGKRDTVRAAR